jgi:hypothetical protein
MAVPAPVFIFIPFQVFSGIAGTNSVGIKINTFSPIPLNARFHRLNPLQPRRFVTERNMPLANSVPFE